MTFDDTLRAETRRECLTYIAIGVAIGVSACVANQLAKHDPQPGICDEAVKQVRDSLEQACESRELSAHQSGLEVCEKGLISQ